MYFQRVRATQKLSLKALRTSLVVPSKQELGEIAEVLRKDGLFGKEELMLMLFSYYIEHIRSRASPP